MCAGDSPAKRGLEAFTQRKYHLAVQELTAAVEDEVADYDLAELYTVLGRAYQEQKQYQQALVAHEKALEIKPEYHKAWNNLGIVYFCLNNYTKAEECHQKALAIAPEYAYALASLGAVYIHRNSPHQAIEVLAAALMRVPGIAVAHSNLALAYAMVSRFDEAEEELQQATLLGYKNWREVQDRISSLKAIGWESDQVTRTEWVSSICARCGAPLSVSQSKHMADCAYCGAHIERKAGTY